MFAKHEKEVETRMQAGMIYSQDIGMEFGREKCAMLIMKSEQNYQIKKNQNALRKGSLQILGNSESGQHQKSGDERKKIK